MPTIPSSKRQIQEQVFKSPDISLRGPRVGQTNVGTGDQVQALGQVRDLYQKYRDENDRVELESFKTKLRSKQNELTHDPNVGFFNLRGKDTVTSSDKYNEDYEKFYSEEIGKLGSDKVKSLATQMAQGLQVDFNKSLMAHTSREMDQYDNEQTRANISSIKDHAILNYKTSPEKIGQAIKEQQEVLSAFADRKGMSKEQRNLILKESESDIHSGVIYQAIADNNDLLAGEYYRQAKKDGKLTAEDSLKLERAVDQASTLGASQRLAGEIMSKGLTQSQALEEARKIEEPRLKDELTKRIKLRYAEQRNLKELQLNDTFQALAVRSEKMGLDSVKKDPRWFDLNLSMRNAIESRAESIARGKEPKTDVLIYDMLNTMASVPETRDKFLRTPLELYMDMLSYGDFKKMSDLQKSLRKGSTDKAEGIFSNIQIAKDIMKDLDISGEKEQAEFRKALQDRALQWERDHGKKITSDELNKLGNELGMKVITDKGWLWDTKTPKYKLTNEQISALTIDDVPDEDYKQIVAVLERQGAQVSADEILKRYKRVKLGSK